MLRRVMHLEPPREAMCLLRRECVVQAGERVDVEVVHHEHDCGRCRVNLVGEATEKPGHIDGGATLSRFEHAGAGERLDGGKDIRRAASLVLVIDSGRGPGHRWERCARVLEELLARLVEAHLWMEPDREGR